MRLLLDTHTLLWSSHEPQRLSMRVSALLCDTNNELYISLASCWEIAIKLSLGKLRLGKPLDHLIADEVTVNGSKLLPIELRHIMAGSRLPFHHRDPFDRLLVAQALTEDMPIVTVDGQLAPYGVTVIW